MAVYHYATGIVNWAKVLGEPVPNYNRDGYEWTFDFTPDPEGMQLFKDLKIAGKLKEKDGVKYLRFTQKAKQANGKDNFPITVVDGANRDWDPNVKIGNGSTIEVKFKVVDYGKGLQTMGIYPQAIRVLELKPYVRQEFAPLPEDSQYAQNWNEGFDEPTTEEATVVEADPLNA